MSTPVPPGTPRPQQHAPAATFDARALTAPVDKRAVRRFNEQLGRQHPGLNTQAIIGAVVLCAVAVVVGGSMFFGFLGTWLTQLEYGAAFSPLMLAPLLILALIVLVVWLAIRNLRSAGTTRYRIAQFAHANAMTYVPRLNDPRLPGMIFGIGKSRYSEHLVRGDRPRFVEFGNYQYTTGSGKNRSTHKWGYVAVKLDTPLPHIVLDAKGNNGLFGSNLPASFGRDQRLSLEGDFDDYFSLYCPEGYERDALYLFTPDIMARFMDRAAELDVEIVDDWMFLYAKREFVTLDPATWSWMFSVVGALLDKLAQWGRWRDERLRHHAATQQAVAQGGPAAAAPAGPDGVAPALQNPAMLRPPRGVAKSGRRLKKSFSWAGLVILAVVVLVNLLPFLFA